jgi:glycosyltransferase involved in cell wall biosynthesis
MTSISHQQAIGEHTLSVVVVDNASNPAISKSVFEPLNGSRFSTKLIQEPIPGIARARAAAANATLADWILFVDDDNELDSNYLSNGLRVIHEHPTVGCFGGKLALPDSIRPPSWSRPFLPYLGIKDFGEQRVECLSNHWGPWEPPTAGAFVHRDVLREYLRRANASEHFFRLGRTAGKLLSCEDSILMRGAAQVGRSNAYEPSLTLQHHLAPFKFKFSYLVRLMYGYGISHVILEAICNGPQAIPEYYKSKKMFLKLCFSILLVESRKSVHFAVGMVAYHLGARKEHFALLGGEI